MAGRSSFIHEYHSKVSEHSESTFQFSHNMANVKGLYWKEGQSFVVVLLGSFSPSFSCNLNSVNGYPPLPSLLSPYSHDSSIRSHREKSGLTRFPANESPRRTCLHSYLSAKSSFYLPAFEISRSCRTAYGLSNLIYRYSLSLCTACSVLSFIPEPCSSISWTTLE